MADREWLQTTIGALCDSQGGSLQTGPFGSQLHAHDYQPDGEVAVVPTSAIGRRRLLDECVERIPRAKADELSRHYLKPGDILFARRGAQATGLSALVEVRHAGWLCGTGAIRLRIASPEVSPQYLSHVLASATVNDWIRQHAIGATMPNLNEGVIRALPLLLPPPAEQRAIASILGALDDKIDLNRRMNETLEELARTIFKSWFVDFDPVRAKAEGRQPVGMDAETAELFPSRFVGEIPEGWSSAPVKDLCARVENGGTPKRDVDEYWNPGEFPWLTSGEVRQTLVTGTEQRISGQGLASSSAKLWPAGTTIVAMYGATAGEVTFSAMELCANQACCGLIPRSLFRAFVYFSMLMGKTRLANFARGSAQQNLSQSLVAGHSVVQPAPELAGAFESLASPLLNQRS